MTGGVVASQHLFTLGLPRAVYRPTYYSAFSNGYHKPVIDTTGMRRVRKEERRILDKRVCLRTYLCVAHKDPRGLLRYGNMMTMRISNRQTHR